MSEDVKQVKMDNNISDHDKDVLNRIFNPGLPFADNADEELIEEDETELNETIIQVKSMEVVAVKAAEAGDLQTALDTLNECVVAAPNWASAYNNRAQVLRLRGDVQGALEDLNKALELSNNKGKAASQAYTQRGLIHRLEGNDTAALEDFKHAARLGSEFAKQLVVSLNPYAAMCNQMLSEVMQKIRTG